MVLLACFLFLFLSRVCAQTEQPSADCVAPLVISGTTIVNGVAKTVIAVTLNLGQTACFLLLSDTPGQPARVLVVQTETGVSTLRFTDYGKAIPSPKMFLDCCAEDCAPDVSDVNTFNVPGSQKCCDAGTCRYNCYDNPVSLRVQSQDWSSCNSERYKKATLYEVCATGEEVSLYRSTYPGLVRSTVSVFGSGSADPCSFPATQDVNSVHAKLKCLNTTIEAVVLPTGDMPQLEGLTNVVFADGTQKYMPNIWSVDTSECNPRHMLWLRNNPPAVTYSNCFKQAFEFPAYWCPGETGAVPSVWADITSSDLLMDELTDDAGTGFVINPLDTANRVAVVSNIVGTINLVISVDSAIVSENLDATTCVLVMASGVSRQQMSDINFVVYTQETNTPPGGGCWIRAPDNEVAFFRCAKGICGGRFAFTELSTRGQYCSQNCISADFTFLSWNTSAAEYTRAINSVTDPPSSGGGSPSFNWPDLGSALGSIGSVFGSIGSLIGLGIIVFIGYKVFQSVTARQQGYSKISV